MIVFTVAEVHGQCARAVIRARLWSSGDASDSLPSMGDILTEITEGGFDGAGDVAQWTARAGQTMW